MRIAIGTRKGLWLADGEGTGWSAAGPEFPMSEVTALAFEARDGGGERLLAGVSSWHWGTIVAISEDAGRSFPEPSGEPAIRFGPDDDASLERVWQLCPDPARDGVVWAGCEPTSLWRSEDDGATFSLVRGLWDHPHRPQWAPGFGGAAVHTIVPRDEGTMVVAMSTGGVYRSEDDGASWRPTNTGIRVGHGPDPYPEFGQCVHKVAADAGAGAALYAQNHHGVYRSDDDGVTWASIADGLPSDFGFTILAHPERAGTAWVIPLVADVERIPPEGRLRVWRTDDGGRSWTVSRAGLPDDCYTVVLRDAADVAMVDGRAVLAFGTRDGCVYVSTDEGETFELAASHLPDVLCVRVDPAPSEPT